MCYQTLAYLQIRHKTTQTIDMCIFTRHLTWTNTIFTCFSALVWFGNRHNRSFPLIFPRSNFSVKDLNTKVTVSTDVPMTFIYIVRGCQILQGADIYAKCIYHHFNSCLTLRKTIFIHPIKKKHGKDFLFSSLLWQSTKANSKQTPNHPLLP